MKIFFSKYDKQIAAFWSLLTFFFLILLIAHKPFMEWSFNRHHHQFSWYIRPLFLIPFCYFAYKQSLTGISITIFLLFTSMFWFPKPEIISEQVKNFLQFEKDWLTSSWNIKKIAFSLLVPFSLTALAFAFWIKSLWIGLSVIVLIAIGKICWSVYNAGESGKSILIPALIGLFICCVLIIYGFKKMEKRKKR
ncbi:MAG TPA: hypothetical protein PKZ43_09690 [Bacteroidales bacterium]|nr:hypothetical protein [Bacteroidales bacterium]